MLQNLMVLCFFSVLDGKHSFSANLVQDIKIVSLNCNLLPRLIKNLNIQNSKPIFSQRALSSELLLKHWVIKIS